MTEANVVVRANFYRGFRTTIFILAYQDNSSQENIKATAPFDSTLNVWIHGTDYFNCIANSIIETKKLLTFNVNRGKVRDLSNFIFCCAFVRSNILPRYIN